MQTIEIFLYIYFLNVNIVLANYNDKLYLLIVFFYRESSSIRANYLSPQVASCRNTTWGVPKNNRGVEALFIFVVVKIGYMLLTNVSKYKYIHSRSTRSTNKDRTRNQRKQLRDPIFLYPAPFYLFPAFPDKDFLSVNTLPMFKYKYI